MIDTENPNEARKHIEQVNKQGKPVIVQGKSIDFNRLMLENRKVNMLILSHTNKKDKLKQRDSGLNHVLCNLARQNNITLAIDFKEILDEKDKKARALILARLEQNLKLMKKSGNKIKIINKQDRNNRDLFSFLLTLRASTSQAKDAIN